MYDYVYELMKSIIESTNKEALKAHQTNTTHGIMYMYKLHQMQRYSIILCDSSLSFFVFVFCLYLLVEFMTLSLYSLCILYNLFTCQVSYPRQLRSLLLSLCDVFLALINSLACWFCTGAVGPILFLNITVRLTLQGLLSSTLPLLQTNTSSL